MRLCSVLLCFVIFQNGSCKLRGIAKHITHNSIEYFENIHNITIPIMMHFDKDLTFKIQKVHKNRTRSALRTISKNLLKEAERMFQQPSLNKTIKLKLLDTKYLKRRLTNDTNVSTYLRKYCRWQGERKKMRKKKYFSVLLTGLDVYYVNRGKKVWSSTGRSYIGAVCSVYHSCSLLEWKGRNIVYLLAHEIAHSLGVHHDGQHPRCPDKKHIMTRDYDPQKSPDTWSVCSRLELQKFLSSRESRCLRTGFEIN